MQTALFLIIQKKEKINTINSNNSDSLVNSTKGSCIHCTRCKQGGSLHRSWQRVGIGPAIHFSI